MGIMKSELNRCKSVMEKDLGYKSNVVIAGSNFEERMFIKLSKNKNYSENQLKRAFGRRQKNQMQGVLRVSWNLNQDRKENENTPMKEWTSFEIHSKT